MIVNVKVVEGDRTRVQAYEGVVIARSGGGLNENFTVRKLSYGEGVERVFPVYSPMIDSVKVVRRGKVRRAKLYYLKGRTGKSARIVERPAPSLCRRCPGSQEGRREGVSLASSRIRKAGLRAGLFHLYRATADSRDRGDSDDALGAAVLARIMLRLVCAPPSGRSASGSRR